MVTEVAMNRHSIDENGGWVEATGYDGLSEVEIFSVNNWWTRDADEVLTTCIERHRTVV